MLMTGILDSVFSIWTYKNSVTRIGLNNTLQTSQMSEITNKKLRVDPSAAPPIIVLMLDKTSCKKAHR